MREITEKIKVGAYKITYISAAWKKTLEMRENYRKMNGV